MDHPIVHFEIPADNPPTLAKFYTELLGWKVEPTKEYAGYWALYPSAAEGALMGGMMKRQSPQHSPTNYVLVESVADYLAKAVSLGAKVVVDKTEIPGMGWFGVLLDPQGNPLGLFEAKAK